MNELPAPLQIGVFVLALFFAVGVGPLAFVLLLGKNRGVVFYLAGVVAIAAWWMLLRMLFPQVFPY